MFSLGMAAPNLKAVSEGRVAGKMVFDIIDRQPKIDQDANLVAVGNGNEKNGFQGRIEFVGVNFTYPTRKD